MEGVPRNSEDGPSFSTFNLRITWTLDVGNGSIDFIAEAFNLLNQVNYDPNSVDNAEFLSGPTLVNPGLPYTSNPNFGNYGATLPPRPNTVAGTIMGTATAPEALRKARRERFDVFFDITIS